MAADAVAAMAEMADAREAAETAYKYGQPKINLVFNHIS